MKTWAVCLSFCLSLISVASFADKPNPEDCAGAMRRHDPELEKLEASFSEVVENLKKLGAVRLLEGFQTRTTKVVFKGGSGFLPDVAIGGREWAPKLLIRRLKLASAREYELSMWKVALGLYRIELRRSFRASMIRSAQNQGLAASTLSESPKKISDISSFEVFSRTRLARIEELQNEMYAILRTFYAVWWSELLPKTDPAANPFIKTEHILGDPGRYILMNQKDYHVWFRDNSTARTRALADRHLSMLNRAYVILRAKVWGRNTAIAGTLATGVAAAGFIEMSRVHEEPMPSQAQFEILQDHVFKGKPTDSEVKRLYGILLRKQAHVNALIWQDPDVGINYITLGAEIREIEEKYASIVRAGDYWERMVRDNPALLNKP